MTEEAEALKEVAKTAGKAIDAASGFFGFVKQIFGDLMVDSVGLMGDKLKAYRTERRMFCNQGRNQSEEAGHTHNAASSTRVGVKLIEEAVVSDSDDLQTKWANLLTNAMDPSFNGVVRRNFVSILADMESLDARILDFVVDEYSKLDAAQKSNSLFDRSKLAVI